MAFRALALVIVLPLTAGAAPVPRETEAEKIKRLFGQVVDPDRDTRVSLDGKVLRMRISERPHGFAPKKGMVNAPRILREVDGVFTAVATIRLMKPTSANQQPARYHAGLVILAGEDTVLHHSRQFDTTRAPHRLGGLYSFMLGGRQVRSGTSGGGAFSAESATLRIERTKDKVRLAVAMGNGNWHQLPEFAAPLPERVAVGLYAGHEGNSAFTAEFEDFVISEAKSPAGNRLQAVLPGRNRVLDWKRIFSADWPRAAARRKSFGPG